MNAVGRSVRQTGGISAFVPEPFPLSPLPELDDTALDLLEQATVLLGRLDGITELLPDVDFFISMYVRKEAALSSQLEGTQATLADALRAEEGIRRGVPEDVADILHYIQAMNFGLKRLFELPLSIRLIREVHEKLMSGGRSHGHSTPGEIRITQNWIGGGSPSAARFVPPPPGEVPRCLSELEKFLHSDEATSRLLKAGLAHAQFETIHPFLDGNGRTGRLLVTFYLCQQGILSRPVLYLSEFFKRNREDYFDKLHAYHDRGAVLDWLKFFFEGVALVSDEAIEVCRKITSLRERDMARVSTLGRSSPNAVKALQRLFASPITSAKTLGEVTGLARPNANKLASRLVEAGILTPSDPTEEYGRTFVYKDYLDLFR